jgi:hypothetical protein
MHESKNYSQVFIAGKNRKVFRKEDKTLYYIEKGRELDVTYMFKKGDKLELKKKFSGGVWPFSRSTPQEAQELTDNEIAEINDIIDEFIKIYYKFKLLYDKKELLIEFVSIIDSFIKFNSTHCNKIQIYKNKIFDKEYEIFKKIMHICANISYFITQIIRINSINSINSINDIDAKLKAIKDFLDMLNNSIFNEENIKLILSFTGTSDKESTLLVKTIITNINDKIEEKIKNRTLLQVATLPSIQNTEPLNGGKYKPKKDLKKFLAKLKNLIKEFE